jgi:protein HOOK3
MDLDDYGDDVMADDDDDDDDVHLGGSLEDSLTENNVVELKRSNRRLERQVRALQQEGGSSTDSNQNMVVLQHLLDDSNRLKAQFEKNYLDVSQERDILQSDMARVRQGIPDSLLDESSSTMSARLNIIDLEKENRKLRDEKAKLEQKVKDVRSTFGKDGIDTLDGLDDFKAQYKQMEQKALLLEQQTKKQLQDINKLLLEKDMLQSQSIDQKDLLLDKERLYR